MAKLLSVAEMVAVEKAADAAGLSYVQMMEKAGHSLAQGFIAHSQGRERSVLALVGRGNNGGDALVALAELAEQGWRVSAYLVGERKDADPYVQRVRERSGAVYSDSREGEEKLRELVNAHAFLLDGLLGTGIKLPLRAPVVDVLRQVKEVLESGNEGGFVVAVDCPSGMDCDSGEAAPETLRADLTVCMAAVKQGMLSLPAFELLGDLEVVGIGLPEDLPEWENIRRFVVDEGMVRAALPQRWRDAHKGTFGTALIVAGSAHYPGAALLAGRAAARSGAGLVTIAATERVQGMLAGQLPEATWLPLPDEDGWIGEASVEALASGIERATACLMGPGFGMQPSTERFVAQLLGKKLPPLVVDADGLKLLTQVEDWPRRLPRESVLTPHPGEMAILSALEVEEIQADRLGVAERFAVEWDQVVVLKGAFSVAAAPDGRTAVIPVASPALATAGTGDVLAGVICGLRAQGMPAYEAAFAGAWLHGLAGLRAAKRLGSEAGVIAGDLIEELPGLL